MATCPSCHHANPERVAYCEACGAAMPHDDVAEDDGVLSMMLGLVCPNCDSYNDPGAPTCMLCGHALEEGGPSPADPPAAPALAPAVVAAPPPAAPADTPAWMQAPVGQPLATVNAMPAVDLKQVGQAAALAAPAGLAPAASAGPPSTSPALPVAAAPESTCPHCNGGVKLDDKFCRHCGGRLDDEDTQATALSPASGTLVMPAAQAAAAPAVAAGPAGTMMMPSLQSLSLPAAAPAAAARGGASATMFFGAATVERFARLTLVKGHTQFGTQWRLQAGETVIGRMSGMVLFPDDAYLAPRHARVEFRGEDLFIVPEDERNGVFVRIRDPEPLSFGGEFVIGVQRMRLLGPNQLGDPLGPISDGEGQTRFLGSALPADGFGLLRVFQDPRLSEVYFRPQRVLSVGRARCDINFRDDPFLSTRHAQLTRTKTGASLEDLGSRNGTFIRVTNERKLTHGDVIMLGEQVLRVEVSLSLARG